MSRGEPKSEYQSRYLVTIAEPNGHDTQKRLETLNFHIVRYDGLRAATANRASILLSANTLLLAALGLLFANGIPEALKRNQTLKIASIIITLGIAVLILLSVYFALNAIITTGFKLESNTKSDSKVKWSFKLKSSRDLYGAIPDRSPYSHSDTLETYKDRPAAAQDFYEDSLKLTPGRLLKSASAELWTGIQQQHRRYKFLRKAILLFVIGIFAYPFVAFMVLFP